MKNIEGAMSVCKQKIKIKLLKNNNDNKLK